MADKRIQFDASEFKDGETVHMVIRDDGSLYVVPAEVADLIAKDKDGGKAVISRVDTETNTIYFESA